MDAATDTPAATYLQQARVREVETDDRTSVRLCAFTAPMVFFTTIVVAIAVCSFAYPIAAMLLNPNPVPLWLIAAVSGGAVLVGALLAVRVRARNDAGLDDLVIDHAARTVALPRNFGRDSDVVIPFDQLTDIAPADELPRDHTLLKADAFGPMKYRKRQVIDDAELPPTGLRGQMSFTVILEQTAPESPPAFYPIVRWSELRRANAFAHWLRQIVGFTEA